MNLNILYDNAIEKKAILFDRNTGELLQLLGDNISVLNKIPSDEIRLNFSTQNIPIWIKESLEKRFVFENQNSAFWRRNHSVIAPLYRLFFKIKRNFKLETIKKQIKYPLLMAIYSLILFSTTRSYYFNYLDEYDINRMCDCLEDGSFVQFKNIDSNKVRGLQENPKRFWLSYTPKGKVFYGNCESIKGEPYKNIKHRRSKRFEKSSI